MSRCVPARKRFTDAASKSFSFVICTKKKTFSETTQIVFVHFYRLSSKTKKWKVLNRVKTKKTRMLTRPNNTESFISHVCSFKMAGYWPRSFLACLWTSTLSRSINTPKKKLTWPISRHLDLTLGQ